METGKSGVPFDLTELETRVQVAELRVREVEAEIRLILAMAKRRELKVDGRNRKKGKFREGVPVRNTKE